MSDGSRAALPDEIHVVDSHTEGEPTRVIVDGWPSPPGTTMGERLAFLRASGDVLRKATVREPRGHQAMVGALLTPAVDADSVAGIIFFNSQTYLGMCGHGLMGVARTLAALGRIGEGCWRFDTPAGVVTAELSSGSTVTIENVPSRCSSLDVSVEVPGMGPVRGDVAYGGNWFFLAEHRAEALRLADAASLTREAAAIQQALDAAGITGDDGAVIDHVELSGPPLHPQADARNFVLCSSGDYDRSPCGTGTSAVMAARYARGRLKPGERWRQESITGGLFTGWLEPGENGALRPRISGRAFVTGRSVLYFAPDDPFREGFGP